MKEMTLTVLLIVAESWAILFLRKKKQLKVKYSVTDPCGVSIFVDVNFEVRT